MTSESELRRAIEWTWRPEAAAKSLERWRQVRAQEHWGPVPQDEAMLVRVFGASWYFTRFLFYSGKDAASFIDRPLTAPASAADISRHLAAIDAGGDPELLLDELRLRRNEYMLSMLVRWLHGELSGAELEAALSRLAEAVLAYMLTAFELTPDRLGTAFGVLGMGRLAGSEMNFGSDLDLIFLHAGDGDDVQVPRRVQRFLRHVAAVAPLGALYEVDMRLRPHGTAGALITTARAFVEYHCARRETWERQLMTRCRPVFDPAGIGADAMDHIRPHVYGTREVDALRLDILGMRRRVERELGRPRGRWELKRGHGGTMDVDFACHYLQLAHGAAETGLQTSSTREALRVAERRGLLPASVATALREGYEYLRRLETCLRLFDLRNISSFPLEESACLPLARAMGCDNGDPGDFLDQLRHHTDAVRRAYLEILNPDGS